MERSHSGACWMFEDGEMERDGWDVFREETVNNVSGEGCWGLKFEEEMLGCTEGGHAVSWCERGGCSL